MPIKKLSNDRATISIDINYVKVHFFLIKNHN